VSLRCLYCRYIGQHQPCINCSFPVVLVHCPYFVSRLRKYTSSAKTPCNFLMTWRVTSSWIQCVECSILNKTGHYNPSKCLALLTNWQRIISYLQCRENLNAHIFDHPRYHDSMQVEWRSGFTYYHTTQRWLAQLVLVGNLPHSQQDSSYHSRFCYEPDKLYEAIAIIRYLEHVQDHTIWVIVVAERTALGWPHSESSQG
jgi:hypothetical protein